MDNSFAQIPDSPASLEKYIAKRESTIDLKPGTEAYIKWDNPQPPSRTRTAIVYLHGFRASHPEGDPVHKQVARACGANLYLSRMQEHGITGQYPLLDLSEEKLISSARFALEIGKKIGDKVILMGTSTGGSLALYLAAQPELKSSIDALVLYSPLIQFYGITDLILRNTPVRKVLSTLPGSQYLIKSPNTTKAEDRIWNRQYALGGALALGSFVQHNMTDAMFSSVDAPTFIGFYYKNEQQQDKVVSVSATRQMGQTLQAHNQEVQLVTFPDARNHVICSSLVAQSTDAVTLKTIQFLQGLDCHTAGMNHNPKID